MLSKPLSALAFSVPGRTGDKPPYTGDTGDNSFNLSAQRYAQQVALPVSGTWCTPMQSFAARSKPRHPALRRPATPCRPKYPLPSFIIKWSMIYQLHREVSMKNEESMTNEEWLIYKNTIQQADLHKSAIEFTKWIITGCAGAIVLLAGNADKIITLTGNRHFAYGLTLLAASIVAGFAATISSNFLQAATGSVETLNKIRSSQEWEKRIEKQPFVSEKFADLQKSLLWGPLKWTVAIFVFFVKGKNLPQVRMISSATSAFVLCSWLQMLLALCGIFSLVLGVWHVMPDK